MGKGVFLVFDVSVCFLVTKMRGGVIYVDVIFVGAFFVEIVIL